jgi:hypothetical protein
MLLAISAAQTKAESAPQWLANVREARIPTATGKALRANPDRLYPAHCLSNPLGTPANELTVLGPRNVRLGDIDGGGTYSEVVSLRVIRAPCSGGNSALLLRFTRAANLQGTLPAPDVPSAALVRSGQQDRFLRLVSEPNTFQSDTFGFPIVADETLVLEAFAGGVFDVDAAFTLALDTFYNGGTRRESLSVPAYNAATHPGGTQSLDINGYLTGNFYDTQHSGEGIFLEVGERRDANASRYVFFAWFTYGPDGRAYWIVGGADIAVGVRTVTLPTRYLSNGGFAGNFNPNQVTNEAWGSVTLSFPDCNTMVLLFASTHNNAAVPAGSGNRTWTRLTDINGLVCQ